MSLTLSRAELDEVATRMAAAGTAPAGPLQTSLIAGGRSNLTRLSARRRDRRVDPANAAPGQAQPHRPDVSREFRITSALTAADVRVPSVVLCEDEPWS